MKLDLHEYLTRRQKSAATSKLVKPGPVITISREYGCEANPLAQKLARALSREGKSWSIISKEILEKSSRELHLNPIKMERAFTPHERSTIEELFNGFSTRSEIPEKKIYKIISDVVYDYALEGNVIIVGRGGVAISRDIERSLHIRLIAPEDHRIRLISNKRNLTQKRAREIVSSQDQSRRLFIQKLRQEVVDDSIFDLILNTVTLTERQILDTIVAAAKSRKLI